MNPEVAAKFATYPEDVRNTLLAIRTLIIDIASEHELGTVEESLKWGEPSYTVKGGSPVRINWQTKTPDQLGVYFNCSTSLVATFREVYGDELQFARNRELTLSRAEPLPLKPLQNCLEVALRYHSLKKLPLLGM